MDVYIKNQDYRIAGIKDKNQEKRLFVVRKQSVKSVKSVFQSVYISLRSKLRKRLSCVVSVVFSKKRVIRPIRVLLKDNWNNE